MLDAEHQWMKGAQLQHQRRSSLGVGLGRLALKLQRYKRLIAEHPCVMPRLKAVGVTRGKIELGPVC